jgi:hypothetical protein
VTQTGDADAAPPIGMFKSPIRAEAQVHRSEIPRPRASPDVTASAVPVVVRENRLRGKLVDRLTLMADRHRRHVEEQQGTRRPVGPHALGFFYADDLTMSGNPEVLAATRLLFAGEETADLITLLDVLIDRASERPPGTFNPRIHMCNREEPMSYAPELLGIGVTTVFDASAALNSTAYASLGMNRPYKAVARMEDGTDLLLRCDSGFLARVDVRATQTLNVNGRHTRHWGQLTPALLQDPEPQLSEILPRLSVLLDLATGRSSSLSTADADAAQHSSSHGLHRSHRMTVRLRAGSRRR